VFVLLKHNYRAKRFSVQDIQQSWGASGERETCRHGAAAGWPLPDLPDAVAASDGLPLLDEEWAESAMNWWRSLVSLWLLAFLLLLAFAILGDDCISYLAEGDPAYLARCDGDRLAGRVLVAAVSAAVGMGLLYAGRSLIRIWRHRRSM
jgi:hypothetical protein